MKKLALVFMVGFSFVLVSCDDGGDTNNTPGNDLVEADGTIDEDIAESDSKDPGLDLNGLPDEQTSLPDTNVDPGVCVSDADCNGKKCCNVNGENVCLTTCPGVTPGSCESDADCNGKKCCDVEGEKVCMTSCPTVEPEGCQSDMDCGGGQKCCDDQGQKTCMTQCPGEQPAGCQSDLDCSGGQKCCPAMIPGMPSECKADCGGGLPNMPSCESNDDCVGGQTCKDLMGLASLCISECTSADDCGGKECKELGLGGLMSLGSVCECEVDGDCGHPDLKCCPVDVMIISINTCLTECVDLSGLLGGM